MLFFVLLLTPLITRYDRCRQVYLIRFASNGDPDPLYDAPLS